MAETFSQFAESLAQPTSPAEIATQVKDFRSAAANILEKRSLYGVPTERFSHHETIPGVGEVTRAYFMNGLLVGYKCGWTIKREDGTITTDSFRLEENGSVTLLGPTGDNVDSMSVFRADGAIKLGQERMSGHKSARLLREIALVTGIYLDAKSFIKERAYEVLEPAMRVQGSMETTRRIKRLTPLSFAPLEISDEIIRGSQWNGKISRLHTSSESPKIHVEARGNKGETLVADVDLLEERTEMTLNEATFVSDGTGTASELMNDGEIEDAWVLLRTILERVSGATPK